MLNNFDRILELNDGIETLNVKILYYEFNSIYKGNYKSYAYNRLCTILEGEKQVTINDHQQFCYNQNSYLLLPANSHVAMEIEKPTKALVLEINDSVIENASKKLTAENDIAPEKDNQLFIGALQGNVDNCLNRISMALQNTKEKDIKFLLDIYIQEMIYFLLKEKGAASILQTHTDHPIAMAIKQMKTNLLPAISIEEIARSLNMSTPTFSRKFKSTMGFSPKAYYTHLKLLKSKDLLQYQTVNDTAWSLGFENISHFIRLFRANFGCTPKEFQSVGNKPKLQDLVRAK